MVDWLLKGEPRKVQIEALRRSYYGVRRWDKNPDHFYEHEEPLLTPIRSRANFASETQPDPAKSWGHFLEMRLGKTPTLLNEFELFRRDYGYEWCVVLTPNTYKLDWPLEADRFGLSVEGRGFDSDNKGQIGRWINNNRRGGLLAVNYEALRYADSLELVAQVCGPKTLIAADESITIKKHDGQYTKPAIQLAKECGARRALSGKPIAQGPHDMWSQLRFIGEINGFDYHPFKTFFCQTGGFKGKVVKGTKNETRFHEILDRCSFMARRTDWLLTPGKDYSERQVTLTDIQMRHYKQMQEDFLTELESGELVVADQIITRLIKMQQIASGFIIDEQGVVRELVPLDKNPRIQDVKNLLENEVECKVVVYCHFTASIMNLQKALEKYKPAVIRGQMKPSDIVEQKRIFNTERECRVCIGQIQATKYGHNLMGTPDDPCYVEYFFENNYSLNDRSQCEERTQGEGQQYPISIFDVISTPYDYAPIRALQRKEDVAALLLRYDRSTGILPPRPEPPRA